MSLENIEYPMFPFRVPNDKTLNIGEGYFISPNGPRKIKIATFETQPTDAKSSQLQKQEAAT